MGAANTRFHVCRGRRGRMKGEDVRRRRRKVLEFGGTRGWMWEDEGKDGRMRDEMLKNEGCIM